MRSLNSPRVHERKLGYQQVCCCAVEADNALENLNRSMKVSGGLVGISGAPSARFARAWAEPHC